MKRYIYHPPTHLRQVCHRYAICHLFFICATLRAATSLKNNILLTVQPPLAHASSISSKAYNTPGSRKTISVTVSMRHLFVLYIRLIDVNMYSHKKTLFKDQLNHYCSIHVPCLLFCHVVFSNYQATLISSLFTGNIL